MPCLNIGYREWKTQISSWHGTDGHPQYRYEFRFILTTLTEVCFAFIPVHHEPVLRCSFSITLFNAVIEFYQLYKTPISRQQKVDKKCVIAHFF